MTKLICFLMLLMAMVNVALAAYPNIYASAAPAMEDDRPIHPSLMEVGGDEDIDAGERSWMGTTDRCSTATGFEDTTDDELCAMYVCTNTVSYQNMH